MLSTQESIGQWQSSSMEVKTRAESENCDVDRLEMDVRNPKENDELELAGADGRFETVYMRSRA